MAQGPGFNGFINPSDIALCNVGDIALSGGCEYVSYYNITHYTAIPYLDTANNRMGYSCQIVGGGNSFATSLQAFVTCVH
jgi:hypothetical protein